MIRDAIKAQNPEDGICRIIRIRESKIGYGN